MSYYNTTKQRGAVLRSYKSKGLSQDHLILNYLKHHKRSAFTPSEINKRFKFRNWPITSVRRVLSTYTKRNMLNKTEYQKVGPYHRPEHFWKWKGNQSLNK